jgi:hypothetical protein
MCNPKDLKLELERTSICSLEQAEALMWRQDYGQEHL